MQTLAEFLRWLLELLFQLFINGTLFILLYLGYKGLVFLLKP